MANAKVRSSQAIASGSTATVPLGASENRDDLSTLFGVSVKTQVMEECTLFPASVPRSSKKMGIRDDPQPNFHFSAEPIRSRKSQKAAWRSDSGTQHTAFGK